MTNTETTEFNVRPNLRSPYSERLKARRAYLQRTLSQAVIAVFVLVAAGFLISLVWDLRPVPIDGRVDDWSYVKNAISMARMEWLGPYSETTLIKRPLFSLVLAVLYGLNIPYTVFLYSLIFLSSAFLSVAVHKNGVPKWLCAFLFASILFLPTFLDRESMRLVRDPVFICNQLLIIGSVLWLIGTPRVRKNRTQRKWIYAFLFILLALHSGLREEAIVLYPGLIVLLMYYAAMQRSLTAKQRLLYGLKIFLAGVIAVQGSLLVIRTANFYYYGVFILNEHEEGPFPEAMAAIASVRKPDSTTRTLISAAERKQLNDLSPLFRKIGWVLDFRGEVTPQDCADPHECDNADYSHAIFGLRTGAFPELHFKSAPEAAQFYRDLRAEIVTLCESRQIPCELPVRRSMRPPLRDFNLPYLYDAVKVHAAYLLTFANRGFSQDWHEVEAGVISDFRAVTHQAYFSLDDKNGTTRGLLPATAETIQRQTHRRAAVARIYSNFGPYFIALGLVALALRLLLIPFWGVSPALAAAVGLLVMIATRFGAITYISAVDNMMAMNYTVPSYGLLILLCVFSLSALSEFIARMRPARTAAGSLPSHGNKPYEVYPEEQSEPTTLTQTSFTPQVDHPSSFLSEFDDPLLALDSRLV